VDSYLVFYNIYQVWTHGENTGAGKTAAKCSWETDFIFFQEISFITVVSFFYLCWLSS